MKKIFLLIAVMSWLASPMWAKHPINLKGERPIKRSFDTEHPVKAFLEESSNELSLEFTEELGALNVWVSDTQGNVIYSGTVPAVEGSSVTIPLDKELEGEFTLSIGNAEYELNGQFTINN